MKKFLKLLGFGILGLILLFIIIGMSGSPKDSTSPSKSSQRVLEVPQEPDYITTVAVLSSEFDNNALSAGQKYENKLVRVDGVVGNIDKDIMGSPYVMVHNPGDQYQFKGVQCMFNRGDTNQLTSLSKGEKITVEGNLASEILVNILVRNCKVVK